MGIGTLVPQSISSKTLFFSKLNSAYCARLDRRHHHSCLKDLDGALLLRSF
jgi:hypothetical protein